MHVPGPVMVQTDMELYTYIYIVIIIVVTRNRLSCTLGLECLHKHLGHLTMNEPILNYWGNKDMMSIYIYNDNLSHYMYIRGPVDDMSI